MAAAVQDETPPTTKEFEIRRSGPIGFHHEGPSLLAACPASAARPCPGAPGLPAGLSPFRYIEIRICVKVPAMGNTGVGLAVHTVDSRPKAKWQTPD